MFVIDKKEFLTILVKLMGQGDSKKEEQLLGKLSRFDFFEISKSEMIKFGGTENTMAACDYAIKYIYMLPNSGSNEIIHESIHAQDEISSLLIYDGVREGTTEASSRRLVMNNDFQVKDIEEFSYPYIVLIMNQIEKMYGKNSLSTVGTKESMEDFFRSFFQLYNNKLLGGYIAYKLTRIMEKLQNNKIEYDGKAIIRMLIDCQNRLLKMFCKKEMEALHSLEDAKNFLSKLQVVGNTRITDVKFGQTKSVLGKEEISFEYLQEDDDFFGRIYQEVYSIILERFGKDLNDSKEIEQYSYENYIDWKNNAKLLFNLKMGEQQTYQYNGKYIKRSAIKGDDGRIIAWKDEEISREQVEDLEKEYLQSRPESLMRKIADRKYVLSKSMHLFLKNHNFYLYRHSMFFEKCPLEIEKPELLDREEAKKLLDEYYKTISQEELMSEFRNYIKPTNPQISYLYQVNNYFLAIQEDDSNPSTKNRYFIYRIDDDYKYGISELRAIEIEEEKAIELLNGYYEIHPEEKWARFAKLQESYSTGIELYEVEGKHYLMRANSLGLNSYEKIIEFKVDEKIIITDEEYEEIMASKTEAEKEFKVVEIFERHKESNETQLQDEEPRLTKFEENWIKQAKLITSTDKHNIFEYEGKYYIADKDWQIFERMDTINTIVRIYEISIDILKQKFPRIDFGKKEEER